MKLGLSGGLIQYEQTLTPTVCSERCAQANYAYFFLQFSHECDCGNTYGKHGIIDACQCDKPCAGDSKEICGGSSKNSIYANQYLDECYELVEDMYWNTLDSKYLKKGKLECCKLILF